MTKTKKTKKTVFVMIDGVGDRTIPQLGYKTPLQYVTKPNTDLLASLYLDFCVEFCLFIFLSFYLPIELLLIVLF